MIPTNGSVKTDIRIVVFSHISPLFSLYLKKRIIKSSRAKLQFYCVDRFGDKHIHSKYKLKVTEIVKTTLGRIMNKVLNINKITTVCGLKI